MSDYKESVLCRLREKEAEALEAGYKVKAVWFGIDTWIKCRTEAGYNNDVEMPYISELAGYPVHISNKVFDFWLELESQPSYDYSSIIPEANKIMTGLLENKIRDPLSTLEANINLDEILKQPRIPLNQYHHGYYKGYAEAVKNILEVVAEAKADYPSLTSLGLVPILSDEDIEKIAEARRDWFVRWFGE